MTTQTEELYDVVIFEKATRKIDAIIGTKMKSWDGNGSGRNTAELRVQTGQERINERHDCIMVEAGEYQKMTLELQLDAMAGFAAPLGYASLSLMPVKRTADEMLKNMAIHYSQPRGFVGRNICYLIMAGGVCYGSIAGGSATRFLPGREVVGSLNNGVNEPSSPTAAEGAGGAERKR